MMPRALNSCSFPFIDCDLLPPIIRCIQLSHQSLFAIVIQQNDFRYRWNIFPSGLYENIEHYLSYFKHFQSLIFRRFVTLFWRLLYAIFNVSFPNFHIAIIELHARQRVKYLCCLLHWYAFRHLMYHHDFVALLGLRSFNTSFQISVELRKFVNTLRSISTYSFSLLFLRCLLLCMSLNYQLAVFKSIILSESNEFFSDVSFILRLNSANITSNMQAHYTINNSCDFGPSLLGGGTRKKQTISREQLMPYQILTPSQVNALN